MTDPLAELTRRLGYALDPDQLAAMGEAVAAAESAAAVLRGVPVAPADADPARGDAWVSGAGGPTPEAHAAGVPDVDATDGRACVDPAGGGARDAGGSTAGAAHPVRAAVRHGVGTSSAAGAPTTPVPLGRAELAEADRLRELWSGRVEESLDRLGKLHAELNCTIRLLRERALDRPVPAVPRLLEGVPFAVKDVIDVGGVPTTAASLTRRDAGPAPESATVVARLEALGAIPVSKDATTEFAVGGPHPPMTGPCLNPWDPDRWAGGSSTGTAAAVAAGAVPFGLGSDVGGSVRLPAAWCGLTGLKPTAGAIPRTGSVPLSWTTETLGPLARDACTVALLFALLRGPDGRDPRATPLPPFALGPTGDLRGLRVARPGGYLTELCDDAVAGGVDQLCDVLVDAGAEIVPADVPSAAGALPTGYRIVFTEAAALHRVDADRWGNYDPVTVRRISQGITTPASDYLRALQFRVELQAELAAVFACADLIVVPTTPATAPRLPDCTVTVNGEQFPLYAAQSRATMLGNLTGTPGLAVPTGLAPDGLPTSALLIAPPHAEGTALRAAVAYQDRTTHHHQHPPIADRIA